MCSGLDLLVWLLLYSPSPRHMLCYALGYQKYIIFVKNFKTIFTYIVQAWAHRMKIDFSAFSRMFSNPPNPSPVGFILICYFSFQFLIKKKFPLFSLFSQTGIILLFHSYIVQCSVSNAQVLQQEAMRIPIPAGLPPTLIALYQ